MAEDVCQRERVRRRRDPLYVQRGDVGGVLQDAGQLGRIALKLLVSTRTGAPAGRHGLRHLWKGAGPPGHRNYSRGPGEEAVSSEGTPTTSGRWACEVEVDMPKYPFLSDEWVDEAHRIYAEVEASGALGATAFARRCASTSLSPTCRSPIAHRRSRRYFVRPGGHKYGAPPKPGRNRFHGLWHGSVPVRGRRCTSGYASVLRRAGQGRRGSQQAFGPAERHLAERRLTPRAGPARRRRGGERCGPRCRRPWRRGRGRWRPGGARPSRDAGPGPGDVLSRR